MKITLTQHKFIEEVKKTHASAFSDDALVALWHWLISEETRTGEEQELHVDELVQTWHEARTLEEALSYGEARSLDELGKQTNIIPVNKIGTPELSFMIQEF